MEQLDEVDPIVLKIENSPKSPRAYALAALATGLVKVVDCHKDIQYAFRNSLNLYVSPLLTGKRIQVLQDLLWDIFV